MFDSSITLFLKDPGFQHYSDYFQTSTKIIYNQDPAVLVASEPTSLSCPRLNQERNWKVPAYWAKALLHGQDPDLQLGLRTLLILK